MNKVSEIENVLDETVGKTGIDDKRIADASRMLGKIKPFVLPVVSILDACKVPVLQRMFQNLSLEQLEEVENFARSTVKHPSKYIEYVRN